MQRHLVGAQGPLTDVVGEFIPTNGTTYTNMHFTQGFRLNGRVGVTLINCRITGGVPPIGNAGYTVKGNSPGGSLDMLRCTVITLANNTKGVVFNDTSTVRMVQCLILGGADCVSINPHATANLFEDNRAAIVRECFIGDLMDPDADPHSDAYQTDGGEGAVLIERNRIEAFNIPPGTNPLTATANPVTSEGGNAAIILTQDSSDPVQIGHVDVIDNYVDGGNYTVYLDPGDEGFHPLGGAVTGNRFGPRGNFGPLIAGPNDTVSGNVWAWSGIANISNPTQVVVGEPVCVGC